MLVRIISVLIKVAAGIGLGEVLEKLFPASKQYLPAERPRTLMSILSFLGLVAVGAAIWSILSKFLKIPGRFRMIAILINILTLAWIGTAFGAEGVTIAVLIGTAAGGIGVPFNFNLTWLPEYIHWNDAGNPINNMVIETTEDGVLHDWLAAAIAAMNGYGNVGALAANNVKMLVADGELKNKTVTIRGTTSAVGAINFFAGYDNQGVVPFKTANLNVLANNPTVVTNFFALFLPNLVTVTDRVEVTYDDGSQVTFDAAELAARSVEFQDAPAIILNNIDRRIIKAQIVSALGGAAYVFSAALPGQK